MKEWLNKYIADHRKALEALPLDALHTLILKMARSNEAKKRIFVFGNGGSASTSSHFVNDMAKSASDKVANRFKCLSLNENMSLITAISNDYSYQDIFRIQLENLASLPTHFRRGTTDFWEDCCCDGIRANQQQ